MLLVRGCVNPAVFALLLTLSLPMSGLHRYSCDGGLGPDGCHGCWCELSERNHLYPAWSWWRRGRKEREERYSMLLICLKRFWFLFCLEFLCSDFAHVCELNVTTLKIFKMVFFIERMNANWSFKLTPSEKSVLALH